MHEKLNGNQFGIPKRVLDFNEGSSENPDTDVYNQTGLHSQFKSRT